MGTLLPEAGIKDRASKYLWDVITCLCPWYLLMAQESSIVSVFNEFGKIKRSVGCQRMLCLRVYVEDFIGVGPTRCLWGLKKWLTFYRRYLQNHFLNQLFLQWVVYILNTISFNCFCTCLRQGISSDDGSVLSGASINNNGAALIYSTGEPH